MNYETVPRDLKGAFKIPFVLLTFTITLKGIKEDKDMIFDSKDKKHNITYIDLICESADSLPLQFNQIPPVRSVFLRYVVMRGGGGVSND